MTKNHEMIGSVSAGTHRPNDLIPAFMTVLEIVDPTTCAKLSPSWPDFAREDNGDYWYDGEDAATLLDSLFDALDEIAPEGMYFGAHMGDGTDFGYWPTEGAY